MVAKNTYINLKICNLDARAWFYISTTYCMFFLKIFDFGKKYLKVLVFPFLGVKNILGKSAIIISENSICYVF